MEKMFGKEYLLDFFKRIGNALDRDIEAFILGGGAMCFRNQKNGTKDLDIVFKNDPQAASFAECAKTIGFAEPKVVVRAYLMMKAYNILESNDGFRLDIFSKTVCRALSLTKSMISRSEKLGTYGRLAVRLVSNEDIILFKGITERGRDADDIAAVVRSSNIDWGIVMDECRLQSATYAWYGMLYNKLSEIEKKHGIGAPIMKELLKLDREILVKEAFEIRIRKGMSKKEAITDLAKMGFTRKELRSLQIK